MTYQGSLQLEKYLDEVLDKNTLWSSSPMLLKIFNGLKKGNKVKIKYSSKGKSSTSVFVVTQNKSVVGKDGTTAITLKPDGKSSRIPAYLYYKNDIVDFAMGDMRASLIGMKKEEVGFRT